jgi:hypothetical protein
MKVIGICAVIIGALCFVTKEAGACSCSNQFCSLNAEQSALA